MSIVFLGLEAEVIFDPAGNEMREYKSEEGRTALEEVLADKALMAQIKSRIDTLFEEPPPTPTPTPKPPSGIYTPEDMRNFVNGLPEELKLVVDEDVAIRFTEPEAMETRDVPVHWWHIPSMSSVWHCPRGLSLRGRVLCDYTGIKKFYKSEEGASRLDELLRDEELERRIRVRLSELYSLVWAEFDRAIPFSEAIEILSISAKQVLEDDDWGFANGEVCVEIHAQWFLNHPDKDPAIPLSVLDGLIDSLGGSTIDVYLADEHDGKTPCPVGKPSQQIRFERPNVVDDKIYVMLQSGCFLPECWGGISAWRHTFSKDHSWYLTDVMYKGGS
jgi:hypothetical protein